MLHLNSVFWLFFWGGGRLLLSQNSCASDVCSRCSAVPHYVSRRSRALTPFQIVFMCPMPKEVLALTPVCWLPPRSAALLTLSLLAGGHPAISASGRPLVLQSIALFIQPGREHSAWPAFFIRVLLSL